MGIVKKFKLWLALRNTENQLRSFAVGMNSTVDIPQDLHIIMLDYDIADLEKVRESVEELQGFWMLADAQVFRTKHGYHVFFFNDIVPYERLKLIIDYAKYVDPQFKYISKYYDKKTIRVAGKYEHKDISFVETIKGIRTPSTWEREIGEMKRGEHKSLLRM